MNEADLDMRFQGMKDAIAAMKRVVVAFSAGVDSTFVLKVAVDVLGRENVIAATSRSDSLAASEFEESKSLARSIGVEHLIVETAEFSDPNYLSNPVNRCYFCKTALYDKLVEVMKDRGFSTIINGINADDFGDFRPGIVAGDERNVLAPAADAGLSKADIRTLSQRLGLPTHDKPAAPCLSSRVQYGESITPEKLAMIDSCEAFLHGLGVVECRVRHHNNLARIEVPQAYISRLADPAVRQQVEQHFRAAGYQYITLDLTGFRSGSMNEVIAFGKRQSVQDNDSE